MNKRVSPSDGYRMAMAGGVSLASVVHPYPTRAVSIRQCGEAYDRTHSTPTVAKICKRWLAWTM